MSLFRDTMRPPAVLSDQAIEGYLAAVRAELEPDPLFRRRLRGQVLNRYVAAREGILDTPSRRRMGRLGRAALYASFALAATTTSVLAASQEAVPGELLYPFKRHVESLRVQVLPEHLQDDLAAYELAERMREMAVLAQRGDEARLAGLAAIVERDYEAFIEISRVTPGSNSQQLTVLSALMERLPDPAQAAIAEVIDRQSSRTDPPAQERSDGSVGGPSGGSQPSTGVGISGGQDAPDAHEPAQTPAPDSTPKAASSPSPDPTPQATRSPRPQPTQRNAPSSQTDATDSDDQD